MDVVDCKVMVLDWAIASKMASKSDIYRVRERIPESKDWSRVLAANYTEIGILSFARASE